MTADTFCHPREFLLSEISQQIFFTSGVPFFCRNLTSSSLRWSLHQSIPLFPLSYNPQSNIGRLQKGSLKFSTVIIFGSMARQKVKVFFLKWVCIVVKNKTSLVIYFYKTYCSTKTDRVINGISQKVFLSHWTAGILYLHLKGTCFLNCKKLFQLLKPKYVAYPFQWGACCK